MGEAQGMASDPVWLTIGGGIVACLAAVVSALVTRWMDRQDNRQDKDDDLALINERRITVLETALAHIATDQTAHERQAVDLQAVKTDVAVLKQHARYTTKTVDLVSRQMGVVLQRLGEPSAADGAQRH